MDLTLATWNINSVRLRLPIVRQFVEAERPDVLCLQETKVEDGKFPLAEARALGFPHVAINGQPGYHGVAVFSKHPIDVVEKRDLCGTGQARHIAVRFAREAGRIGGLTVHNFYIPAGGDVPDPAVNDKFAHKLRFLDEMEAWFRGGYPGDERAILVGDLNIAPCINDVWSHRQLLDVVSHTPVETEAMNRLLEHGAWTDLMRRFMPEPQRLYTWWSYRSADWLAADKGRRLDHIWTSPALEGMATGVTIHKEARGWERPSDHVPVTATFRFG